MESPKSRAFVPPASALLPLLLVGPALAQGPPPPPPPPPPAVPLLAPPVPVENPITEPKRILGKIIFWDEQLSSADTVSCGTCHQPSAGGGDLRAAQAPTHPGPDGVLGTPDDRVGSPGVHRADVFGDYTLDALFGFEPQVTERASPSNLMAPHFPARLMWDGRAEGPFLDPLTGAVVIPFGGSLEIQSLGPILSDVEMADEGRTWDDVTSKLAGARPLALAWDLPLDIATRLTGDPSYGELFQDAFGTPDITPVRIALALATYQRTLVPDQTPFDDFASGNPGALTPQQQNGWLAFNSPQSRCNACHGGPRFSDGAFHNLGLRPVFEDQGRFGITGAPGDQGRFRTPSLRNVALRDSFFHNGQAGVDDLLDVLAIYDNEGGPFGFNKDPILTGLTVPPGPAADIAAFLEALTDPRVEDELPPFDRPKLNSERVVPLVENLGGAVAGSGGFVPQIQAAAPAHVGAQEFRVGLHGALGDAFGVVAVSLGGPGQATPIPGKERLMRLKTIGFGPGAGTFTWNQPLPDDPALSGAELFVQFWIRDPSLANNSTQFGGGFATSDGVRLTIQ